MFPKQPPLDSGVRRLAVAVDDHDLSFGEFEGTIPAGEYGAGTITIWDRGTYEIIAWSNTRISVHLHGHRLNGVYELHRFTRKGQREWLVTKADHPSSA